MRTRGVLAVRPREPRFLLIPEQRQQLETFAALIAIALERVHYVEVAQSATVQMESERLRNSLLAALSHDLRTPLAALVGLAETLAREPAARSSAQQLRTGREPSRDEARRMSATGDQPARHGAHPERRGPAARGVAVDRGARRQRGEVMRTAPLGTRALERRASTPALPLVEFDAVLIERVLANLLENAAKYTPAGTPVEILVARAGAPDAELLVSVRDHGPGVPPGQEEIDLREIHARARRVGDARRRPRAGDLPRHRRSAPRPHLRREPTHPQWRHASSSAFRWARRRRLIWPMMALPPRRSRQP